MNLRKIIWYLTDKNWRRSYRENERRKKHYRVIQRRSVTDLINQTQGKPTIVSGPFAGMIFPNALRKDSYSANILLGTYEKEIHPWILQINQNKYQKIIDLGADIGWFAVGMARNNPKSEIVAYETETSKHQEIQNLANANEVQEISVYGFCDEAALSSELARNSDRKTLLIVDIEGGENAILNPEVIPMLKHVDLLIETHDHIVSETTDLLISRFMTTHDIEVAEVSERTLDDFPTNVVLPVIDKVTAMSECRHSGQKWLFMRRKSK